MRGLTFFVFIGLAGCGARVIDGRHVEADPDASATDGVVTSDTALVDTAVVDTSISFDAEPVDEGFPVCDTPVSGFSCAPVATKGMKTCTDKQIQAFIDGCFGPSADSGSCSAAQAKYADCSECIIDTFITPGGYIDVGACMKKVKPASSCAGSVDCLYDCWAEACGSCDPTSGSSEYNECLSRQSDPSGSCYEFGAKDYDSCTSDPDLAVCVPATIEGLLPFYRGACRDGGDWSKTDKKDGTL